MLGWLVAAGWIDQPERMIAGCCCWKRLVGFGRHRPGERSSFRRVQGFPGCYNNIKNKINQPISVKF
jgi:hypothetical protein